MDPKLLALRDEVVRLVSPLRIMVFSRKQTLDGTLASVKLAVIIGAGDPHAAEHRLYMELEADIPFDVVVYTAQEWGRFSSIFAKFVTMFLVIIF